MQRDSVTKVAHDVVAVEPEAEDDGGAAESTMDTTSEMIVEE